jgi:hypothetical protein
MFPNWSLAGQALPRNCRTRDRLLSGGLATSIVTNARGIRRDLRQSGEDDALTVREMSRQQDVAWA